MRETGEALKTIGEFIKEINSHMEAIATSAREQATGLAEVNVAVNSMDQTTQQNAAMVEQSNAASNALADDAIRLRELITQFSLATNGLAQTAGLRQMARAMASPALRVVSAASVAKPMKIAANAGLPPSENWEEF